MPEHAGVLGATEDLLACSGVAGPGQTPIIKALVLLKGGRARDFAVAFQEGLQAQEVSCFVDGPAQEEKLLCIDVGLEGLYPIDVAFPFLRNLFHICVSASTNEAH